MELKAVVAHLLVDVDRHETRRLANREAYRDRGYRLVSHDQLGRDLVLNDALTGELLFRGSLEDSGVFFDQSEQPLAVLDTIDGEVGFEDTPVPGLPESLVETLRTWVEDHEAEARDLVEGA